MLYTVGYEGRSQKELLEALTKQGIQALCDVRQHAVSRVPGFSKTSLSNAATAASIAYYHLPALGNPKENRPGYAKGHTRKAAKETFRERLTKSPGATQALQELIMLIAEAPTALLCYEADPQRCHRSDVAAALADAVPDLVIASLN